MAGAEQHVPTVGIRPKTCLLFAAPSIPVLSTHHNCESETNKDKVIYKQRRRRALVMSERWRAEAYSGARNSRAVRLPSANNNKLMPGPGLTIRKKQDRQLSAFNAQRILTYYRLRTSWTTMPGLGTVPLRLRPPRPDLRAGLIDKPYTVSIWLIRPVGPSGLYMFVRMKVFVRLMAISREVDQIVREIRQLSCATSPTERSADGGDLFRLLLLSHFLPPPPPATVLFSVARNSPTVTGSFTWPGIPTKPVWLPGAPSLRSELSADSVAGNGRLNPTPGIQYPSTEPYSSAMTILAQAFNYSVFSEGSSSDRFGLDSMVGGREVYVTLYLRRQFSVLAVRFERSARLGWPLGVRRINTFKQPCVSHTTTVGAIRATPPADRPAKSKPPRRRNGPKLTDPFTMGDVFDLNWQRSDRVWLDEGVYSEYVDFPNALKLTSSKKILRLETAFMIQVPKDELPASMSVDN
ncbi:hypothetical protein GGX14DRAFT_409211 [Mycena pura]|uniref:Uncharacterized protein n=1 Tax=Mycena pura TaxID=153505 RepID=A0AAD6ULE1_9AGAR|nr:hypothetical protein GGX14DRAFT_409211 [Mycena pura]